MSREQQHEEWREIPHFPGYEASSLGRIRRLPYQQKMPQGGYRTNEIKETFGHLDKNGRRKICIKGQTRWVSSLVCAAFSGPKPEGHECMHLDEDHTNNRADNLRWGTRSENLRFPKYREACRLRAAQNRSRLSWNQVTEIRAAYKQTKASVLAQQYGISDAYVRQLWRWRHRRQQIV